MFVQSRRGLQRWMAGMAAAVLMAAGPASWCAARAEEKDLLAELLQRVQRLEQQNQELKQRLHELEEPVIFDRAGAIAPTDGGGVKQVVDDYLQEKERRAQEEEARKKREVEEFGTVVGSDLGMGVRWDHGLTAETADKAFRVHVGGRTQFDTLFYSAGDDVQFGNNGVGRVDDAFAFRRARFTMEGTLWEVIDFWMEYDFLNTDTLAQNVDVRRDAAGNIEDVRRIGRVANTPVPTDLWVQANKIPLLGSIRLGNLKPPFSFEHLTSSRFLNFIERSYGFDAFVGGPQNGFEPGVMVLNNFFDERLHLAAALTKFNQTVFGFNTGDGELALTARAGVFPIWEDDGRIALWLGCAYRHADPDFLVTSSRQFQPVTGRQVRLRARTLLRNGPAELHTPLLDIFPFGDSLDLINPEIAFVCGPWTFVSEYYGHWLHNARSTATGPSVGTHYTQSAYAEVLYFLTGEHRVFNRRFPSFVRVVPHENYWLVKGDRGPLLGRGAWQIGARYSWIDLSDRNLLAGNNIIGSAQSLTLGLNWFLNPNMKLQWNYTYEQRYNINTVAADAPGAGLFPNLPSDGALRGFGMRMAMDF